MTDLQKTARWGFLNIPMRVFLTDFCKPLIWSVKAFKVIHWGRKCDLMSQHARTPDSKANSISHLLPAWACEIWSSVMITVLVSTLREVSFSDRANTSALHSCFRSHEHAWPATPVEHGIWATAGASNQPQAPGHSTYYRAFVMDRVMLCGIAGNILKPSSFFDVFFFFFATSKRKI